MGGRLTKFLSDCGFNIKISTRKLPTEFPSQLPKNCEIIHVDYSSDNDMINLMNGVEYVIHLAGPDAHSLDATDEKLIKSHIKLTQNLFTHAEKSKVYKFIYMSTVHVYGENLKGNVTEKTKPLPIYPFANAHHEAEKFILTNGKRLNCTIIRCSNSFGKPYFPNEKCWSLVVNNLCKSAIETKSMNVRSPNQLRDFIPAGVVCESLLKIISAKDNNEETIINLCSGETISIIEMAEYIQSILLNDFNLECKIVSTSSTDIDNKTLFFKLSSNLGLFDISIKSEISNLAQYCFNEIHPILDGKVSNN